MNVPGGLKSLLRAPQMAAFFFSEVWKNGLRSALSKTIRVVFRNRYAYAGRFDPAAVRNALQALKVRPLISIVMPVHNVSPKWLRLAIRSVENQFYPDWELCIVDDHSTNRPTLELLKTLRHPRIKTAFLDENRGISRASNEAIAMATGEYLTFLDHDDELTPDALLEAAGAIQAHAPDLIYSDEDMAAARGQFVNGHFKPDFSPDLLLSHNYVTHLLVIRRDLLDKAGRFRPEYDGAQDYDLVLRATEQASCVCHVRKVLYHWRSLPTSTSMRSGAKPYTAEAGRRAVEAALRRRGIDGAVEHANLPNYYRVRRTLRSRPLVSIVIPFRDGVPLLAACLDSILSKSTYSHIEIMGISNGSTEAATFERMREFEARDSRIRFREENLPFNYSRLNNIAVRTAAGEHVVLLNNDIEIIAPGWIEALLEHSQREEVGAVGGKLYYPDGRIQHAGIIIGIGGFAGHSHRHFPGNSNGYFNRLNVIQNVSAVTGAMLMVKKSLYTALGGLDETHLATALNDVDFCLRLRERGYLNVYTPYAQARHRESASRGYELTPEKKARFEEEVVYFRSRHRDILDNGDPFYNPNLSHIREDFSYDVRKCRPSSPHGLTAGRPRHGREPGTCG